MGKETGKGNASRPKRVAETGFCLLNGSHQATGSRPGKCHVEGERRRDVGGTERGPPRKDVQYVGGTDGKGF